MANTEFAVTLADGSTETVQTTLQDRLAFEQALRKNRGWGKLEDNTLKMQPFLAWNALRRTGKTDLSWEEFTTGDTAALDVSIPEADPDEDTENEVEGVGKDTPTEDSSTSPYSSLTSSEAPLGSGEVSPNHA
ncbi:MAG: hypothetical protein ACTH30_05405 [Leucobacter sp.]